MIRLSAAENAIVMEHTRLIHETVSPYPGKVKLTGSRACGGVQLNSDWDYIVLVPSLDNMDFDKLEKAGFKLLNDHYPDDEFYIVRNEENVNLVITDVKGKYNRWCLATSLSSKLGLTKENRIVLFQDLVDQDIEL